MTATISTFTPTLMQKLLGRNYKWWYILIYHFKVATNYRTDSITGSVAEFLSFGSTLLAWYMLTKNSTEYDPKIILTYLWVGSLYYIYSYSWFGKRLSDWITNGTLSTKLMTPTNPLWYGFFAFIGEAILANGFVVSTFGQLALLPFVFPNILLPSFSNLLIVILFIPITYFIRHQIEIIFGSVAFWSTNTYGVMDLRGSLSFVLDGTRIPLYIISPFFFPIILQPFAWLLHHPMQIYLGKYSPLETLYVFLGGIGWCVVLYFLAKWVFRMGLKRNESVGL